MDRTNTEPDCDGCPLVPRRAFLRDAGLTAAAVLAALGALPAVAAAARVELVSASDTSGGGNASREEKSYPIPDKDGTQIDKSNDLMITRWQGKAYAYSLACPHQNTALKWFDKEGQFECPKHHSRFQPDGIYVKDSGRATRGLDRFAVRRDGAKLVVDLDKLYQEDENAAEWQTAFITI